ncbi:histidine kinase [Petroclostridium sp. X23]|uniref:sensor histidine kinase n=1 Tax=Petroclostridium sp. X23 TaxID=3045146 RepID=UPI0024AD93C3|nr:histidine kinase [Petroclostridium sp. X23]WHH58012.1 histidine kinase [Petroclostridium sp. X23]
MKVQNLFMGTSIRFRIMGIFLLIIALMAVGFWFSFYQYNTVINRYHQFINTNSDVVRLPIMISQSAEAFEQYLKDKDHEKYKRFDELNAEINRVLESVRNSGTNDDNTLVYFRSLYTMNERMQQVSYKILESVSLNSGTFSELSYLRALYIYMNKQAQWLVISYMDSSGNEHAKKLESYRNIGKNMYIIMIVLVCFSMIFAIMFSNDVFDAIHEVSQVAGLLSNANWEVPDLRMYRYMELEAVANAFNDMKKNIKSYIQELNEKAEIEIQLSKEKLKNIEKDKLLKESKLLALQMQMNPHFLFNTLNMVGRTAMLKDTDSTIALIEAISNVLRYNLENKGRTVSLKEEIDSLKAYIFIQQMRFQDRISFVFNRLDWVEGIGIPPMILQPIVENAIIHGLKDKRTKGRIDISVWKEKDHIYIKINDNGRGIEKNTLEGIFEEQEREQRNVKTSIGLCNIKKRLELYFQQKDLIDIQSQLGIGTSVTISIPLEGELQ